MKKKRLILRLSSLGDVILASTALNIDQPNLSLDWVVASEFSELIIDHPRLNQVHQFDRRTGFSGWMELCRKIWNSEYDEVLDLHKSLRTTLMRFLFLFWSFRSSAKKPPRWLSVSKGRYRLYSYYLLKKFCPRFLRPLPWVKKYALAAGGNGSERPDLSHLLKNEKLPKELENLEKKYFCVMPSSRWKGKMWPTEYYFQLLAKVTKESDLNKSKMIPVILGTASDQESAQLVQLLKQGKVPHISGVGMWRLKQTAFVLNRSSGYLGSDTGLAHLTEAVGVPAQIILGPTTEEMGFAPWRNTSKTIGMKLACRPCGKDGRFCYRPVRKQYCLKGLTVDTVAASFFPNESP